MEKGTKTLLWIIGILALLAIIYWAYTKNVFASIGLPKVVSDPGEESNCNDEERKAFAREEGCLPPATEPLYLVVSPVKERSWTEATLGFVPNPNLDDTREEATKIKYAGSPYTWTYNQTRLGNDPKNPNYDSDVPTTPDRFLFVNDTKYPNPLVN